MSFTLTGKKIDWSTFDATWYAKKYESILQFLNIEGDAALEEFYQKTVVHYAILLTLILMRNGI